MVIVMSIRESLSIPGWRATCNQNDTWDLVPFPSRKTTIGCHWMYMAKYLLNKPIEHLKAQLVPPILEFLNFFPSCF
jgi:hypothetical protein